MKILDRLPYSREPSTVRVRGMEVRIKPYQIVTWASVSIRRALQLDPRTARVPVVLDTGHNHNFSIGRSQLIQWAGISPEALERRGAIHERGMRVPLYAAAIWLHANIAERLEVHASREPFPLRLDQGIAVYPDETAPRLPVLGLRALTLNQLQVIIDGEHAEMTLRTGDWINRMSRWLSRFR